MDSNKNDNRWDFDRWSSSYDESVANDDWIHADYNNVINNIANIIIQFAENKDVKLIDIGAGTGNLLTMLSPHKNIQLYAIEPSRGMKDKLASKCDNVSIIDGSLPTLPDIDLKFDVIVSSYVIHHIEHNQTPVMIESLCRHANSSSMILLVDILFESKAKFESHIQDLQKLDMTDRIEDLRDEYFQYIDEITNNLKKHGFDSIEDCRYNYYTHHLMALKGNK